jgi:dinuclear metal center YbgI/SA1388 family protein
MQIDELGHFCDDFLDVGSFDDYCPNGLQVEGRGEVRKLVSGVSACLALIEAALERCADAILVHHGYFWKGEAQPLTGVKGRRVKRLLQADVSLLAYHLPLDAHPTVGNNAELGRRMGWLTTGQQGLLWYGETEAPASAEALRESIGERLDASPLLIAGGDHPVRRVAWCSGAAQSMIEQAADLGMDAFVSGEISEPTVHLARERGIHYIAAGHHATERFGVQALGRLLAGRFGIRHEFIDIDNPV